MEIKAFFLTIVFNEKFHLDIPMFFCIDIGNITNFSIFKIQQASPPLRVTTPNVGR